MAPRIAVIDDDLAFLDLMQDLLGETEGYEVVTSANWALSLEFLKQTQPDLIILDLVLGWRQTGWAVLDTLREDVALSSIPVILCSAATADLERFAAQAPRSRSTVTLAKPFD